MKMKKESKKMRIVAQGPNSQGYKSLKKRLNATTKDEVIIKLLEINSELKEEGLEYIERVIKSETKLEKLEEIIGKCAYCSEEG